MSDVPPPGSDPATAPEPHPPIGVLQAWRWVRMWSVLVVPVFLFGADALSDVGGLWTLARAANPYVQPDQGFLLYVAAPMSVLGALALFLLPGRLLAERGTSPGAPSFALRQFGWALCWNAVLVLAAASIDPQGWRAGTFAGVAAAACVPLIVLRAVRPPRTVRGVTERPPDGLGWFLPVLLGCVLLGPKLWWEGFNGDGAHAFAVTRTLLDQTTPFLPAEAGPIARFPGATSFAFTYPGAFFLRLLGEGEGPMRVQVFLYLIGLHAAVKAVAGEARPAVAARFRDALLTGLCAVFLLALAFSATYSPYHADIALPATQDTLLLAVFLGFVWATLTDHRGWMLVFALWTYTSLPSGLLLMGAFVAARWLLTRPRPWRETGVSAGALLAAAVLVAIATRVVVALDLPGPGAEYGGGLLRRLTRLQFTDVGRVLYAAIPAGLVPFGALVLWRRQDGVARAVTLVAAGYFLLFYVQGYVSLHHFVPAMVLPWVVFLRLPGWDEAASARKLAGLGAAGVVVAAALAWPSDTRPFVEAKEIALSVEIPPPVAPAPVVYRQTELFAGRFPRPYEPDVPAAALGIADPVWAAYATLPALRRGPPVYRVVEAAPDGEPPAGTERPEAARGLDRALLVLDPRAAAEQRARRPATDRSAPLLRVDRGILVRGLPREGGPRIVHLLPTLRRWKARLVGSDEE